MGGGGYGRFRPALTVHPSGSKINDKPVGFLQESLHKLKQMFVCSSERERGAAGEAAEGMAGLLRDGGRRVGGHAEELPPPQPPPGHPDGGEVVGQIPPDPPLCLSV